MKKTISFAMVLMLALASASASATIITFTDSIKNGVAQHMTIDGNKLLLRNNQLGEYDTSSQHYRAKLQDTSDNSKWTLNLHIDNISSTFATGHNPRCPATEPGCDTSGWLHFEENAAKTSALTLKGGLARYVLDLGWGQYGYNAGGHWVTAQDANAAGFWIKNWTYQTRSSRNVRWRDATSIAGTGGDVNVYASVPEPGALGLFGLSGILLLRRRGSKRKA